MSQGIRRRGRWYALQVLYALDADPDQESAFALDDYADAFELELDERSVGFARELVERVVDHRDALDDCIQSASRNWRLERMAQVDRNILRLATSELLYAGDVPVRVVINEAIELAKRFGTSESPAFVNGILDRIAQSARRDGAR